MPKIKIITNLPSLIVQVYDTYNNCVLDTAGKSTAIPFFYDTSDIEQGKEVEDIIEAEIKQGLYRLRLSLPYFNGQKEYAGFFFPMPVLMDKLIEVSEAKTFELEFKVKIK